MPLKLKRMGDFYEAFDADAEIVAKVLDITLTRRDGRPMAGIPVWCLKAYRGELEAAGYSIELEG